MPELGTDLHDGFFFLGFRVSGRVDPVPCVHGVGRWELWRLNLRGSLQDLRTKPPQALEASGV